MLPFSPNSIYLSPTIPRLYRKPRRLYYLQIPSSNKHNMARTSLRLPLPTLLSTITRHISRRGRSTSPSRKRFGQSSLTYQINFESFETLSETHSRTCRRSIPIPRHSSPLLDTLSNEQRLSTKIILAISYGQKNEN